MIECDRGVMSFFAVMYNQNIDIRGITHTYNAAIKNEMGVFTNNVGT